MAAIIHISTYAHLYHVTYTNNFHSQALVLPSFLFDLAQTRKCALLKTLAVP